MRKSHEAIIQYFSEIHNKKDNLRRLPPKGKHIPGKDGKSGYWFPVKGEVCSCCLCMYWGMDQRGASYDDYATFFQHCTSTEHIKKLLKKRPDMLYTKSAIKAAMKMTKHTAPLYINATDPLLIYVRDYVLGIYKS